MAASEEAPRQVKAAGGNKIQLKELNLKIHFLIVSVELI